MTRLSFLGGFREVGRSAVLVDTGTEKILLDYGNKINVKPTEYPKEISDKLDAVILTHAHLDHCGAIPIIYHQGQKCSFYGTGINKTLAKMLLFDSWKIAMYEGEEEKFTKKDIKITLKHFKPVEYRKPFKIGKTTITFFDAGHIPGSAMILLETNNKRILYTGDFMLSDSRLVKGADSKIPNSDILITESTYSDREHPDRIKEERKMIESIKETIANNGIALISCFAIARTQEILLTLDEYEIKGNVYLDGMSMKATRIIDSYPQLQREYNQVKQALNRLRVRFITNPSIRKKAIKKPSIIVTTSGMLTGGPVARYIEKLYDRDDSTLILTGFQVPGTEGALLLQTGRYIHQDLDLKMGMSVRKFNFSSHAPRSELFSFARKINPGKIFCVHGDNTVRFAKDLNHEFGFNAISPKDNRVFLMD